MGCLFILHKINRCGVLHKKHYNLLTYTVKEQGYPIHMGTGFYKDCSAHNHLFFAFFGIIGTVGKSVRKG